MLQSETLNEHEEKLSSELNSANQRLLKEIPPETYAACIAALPRVGNYSDFGDEIPRLCDSIRGMVGERGLDCYHRLLLLKLIGESDQTLGNAALPSSVRSLYQESLERIARNIIANTDATGFYSHPIFAKELALCAQRLIPCGVLKVHTHGIPRRKLLSIRPSHILNAIRAVSSLGGYKPLFEAHLDSRDATAMLDFHADGFRDACRRIAELLGCFPDVRGFFGASWLHDPQLESVSPNLTFVREILIEVGGMLLDGGPCGPDGIKDATYRSPQRKRLYDRGDYVPHSCLIIVPRSRLLAWANRR